MLQRLLTPRPLRQDIGIVAVGVAIAFVLWIVLRPQQSSLQVFVWVEFRTSPHATLAQENDVARALAKNPFVKQWQFAGAGQRVLRAGSLHGPLPDSITATPINSQLASEVAQGLNLLPGVRAVQIISANP